MELKRIGVIGCGIMGSGIAQVCAMNGLDVIVSEQDGSFLEKGMKSIDFALSKLVKSGHLDEAEKQAIFNRIEKTLDLNRLSDCDLVIEAVTEDLELKKQIFSELDRICRKSTILASNTSVLPITEMARVTSRPERVIGTHFLTPPPVIKLLEVVRTSLTSAETLADVKNFGVSLGKRVVVSRDSSGFIVNRILTSIMFNAVRLLEEEVATQEDIDTAIKDGLGLPMGAFELLDLIGMDTIQRGSTALFKALNDPQYECPATIVKKVSANQLGRKTGKGFYEY